MSLAVLYHFTHQHCLPCCLWSGKVCILQIYSFGETCHCCSLIVSLLFPSTTDLAMQSACFVVLVFFKCQDIRCLTQHLLKYWHSLSCWCVRRLYKHSLFSLKTRGLTINVFTINKKNTVNSPSCFLLLIDEPHLYGFIFILSDLVTTK